MKEYGVEIQLLGFIQSVYAESEEDAIKQVEKMYEDGIPEERLPRICVETIGNWVEEVWKPENTD